MAREPHRFVHFINMLCGGKTAESLCSARDRDRLRAVA